MAIGTVKWFNNAKGYGFILPDGGGEDLFAHFSAIHMDGYKTLRAGDTVEYEVVEGPKGLHADNIRSVATSSDSCQVCTFHTQLNHQEMPHTLVLSHQMGIG